MSIYSYFTQQKGPPEVTRHEYHIENFLGMVRLGCMKIMAEVFVSDYSYRSATMGSTFAARRAGT